MNSLSTWNRFYRISCLISWKKWLKSKILHINTVLRLCGLWMRCHHINGSLITSTFNCLYQYKVRVGLLPLCLHLCFYVKSSLSLSTKVNKEQVRGWYYCWFRVSSTTVDSCHSVTVCVSNYCGPHRLLTLKCCSLLASCAYFGIQTWLVLGTTVATINKNT